MDIYLDKLELHGFKSFPDKTVLKFHKGITAVVGPNGCGKSNIVDAILWVLGEQRIKNLRGENNEDLIFNGSHSKKPLGMTEVGSYFMNHGEQLYFARRYFRSGESKYILNEKYCRNKDIQNALFQMQLGERKYFIFEQGSIDRLISLKPSEKRLLIEEAAGISQYLERKKETTNKLIIAEQNLENIGILITDKDGRLRELKNQVNYAHRFRQLKKERNSFLQTLLKRKHLAFQKDFDVFKSEIEKFINQEAVQVKEISVLEKKDIQLEEKLWQTDKDLKQNQQDTFNTNRNIFSNNSEVEKFQQQNNFNRQKIKEKKETIKSNKLEIQNLTGRVETENQKMNELQVQMQNEASINEKNKSDLSNGQQKIIELKARLSEIKTEIFNIQGKKALSQNSILDMESKINRIQNEMDSKKNFIKELHNQINELEIQQNQNEKKKLTEEIEKGELQYKTKEETEIKYAEKIEKLEMELRNLENEIIGLGNQQQKYGEIKKKIMGFENESIDSQNNELLQDSIEVKKEYHDIIENLYYEELDAVMLIEEEDISQKKANKFLITRQGNPFIPREIEKETGFQAYVTNLVVLRNKKAEPFLKKGILVDNIQNGIKIFKKYAVDVVTQNAEIINKDGLIIRKREKGILNVIDEIKKINNKKTELEKKLQVSTQSLKQEQIKYQNLKETVEKEKNRLSNLKEKHIQVDAKLNELKKNKDTYLNRIKLNESELELLDLGKEKNHNELQKSKKQRAFHDKEHQTLEKKQKEFETNVQELEGDVNQKEKNVLQKDNRINLINEKLTSTRTKLKELEANKLKLANQNNFNLKEISKLEKELSETAQKIKNLEEDNRNLNLNKDTMENQTKNLDQEFENVNKELKAITADLKQKRKTLDDIKENRSKMEIDFSSIKKDIFQLQDTAFKELNTELDQIDEQEDLQHLDASALETQYQTSNDRMIKMRDSDRLNFSAESEYEILSKDHHFLLSQKEDIEKSIADMNNAIKKIDEESQISFLEAFKEITKNYQKNFQILFEGGEAELMLTDADNITETGLEIKAQPPGKRLQSLRLLSGGEKALTSLAFLFALFEYKPSPFCVFDEVDASLDEANVQRFLKFVHKLKERTQFLIITHNFKTMEEADFIYGITMNEPGISTIYSMKMTGKNQLVPEDRS